MTEAAQRPHSGKVELMGIVGWLSVCYTIAGAGAAMTMSGLLSWYPSLQKPWFNPPNWVFGPVWMILYTMMGVSAWLVWRERKLNELQTPMGWFTLQLALNLAWSSLFFSYQNPGLAFVEILLMWVAILATIISFWDVSRLASILLVPYLGWVTFASLLNFAIWRLNEVG